VEIKAKLKNKSKYLYIIAFLAFFLEGIWFPQTDVTIWQGQINFLVQLSITSLGIFGIFIVFYVSRDLSRKDDMIFMIDQIHENEDLVNLSRNNLNEIVNDEIIIKYNEKYFIKKEIEFINTDLLKHQIVKIDRYINRFLKSKSIQSYLTSKGVDKLVEDEKSIEPKKRMQYIIWGLLTIIILSLFMYIGYSLPQNVFLDIPYGINIISGLILVLWIGFIIAVGNFGLFVLDLFFSIPIQGQYLSTFYKINQELDKLHNTIINEIGLLELMINESKEKVE